MAEADDNYDLMPHKEIVKLRGELRELRDALARKEGLAVAPAAQVKAQADMVDSMHTLTKSLNDLLALFQAAGESIHDEPHHQTSTHEHLGSMNMHLDNLNIKMNQLIKHNEEIAKGILVVAEMMKENVQNTGSPFRRPVQRPMPQPQVVGQEIPAAPAPPSDFIMPDRPQYPPVYPDSQ